MSLVISSSMVPLCFSFWFNNDCNYLQNCYFFTEEPKILLPRHLLKPVKIKVGGKLHVNLPYQV